MNRSQTHEYGSLDRGRAIPFLGIHKWDFFVAVHVSLLQCTTSSEKLTFWWRTSRQVLSFFRCIQIQVFSGTVSTWDQCGTRLASKAPHALSSIGTNVYRVSSSFQDFPVGLNVKIYFWSSETKKLLASLQMGCIFEPISIRKCVVNFFVREPKNIKRFFMKNLKTFGRAASIFNRPVCDPWAKL
jgi:hypothetical protein